MTQVRSTSSIQTLLQFNQASEFEDYVIDCASVKTFELQIQLYESVNGGGTITSPTVYLSGSSNNNATQTENPIPDGHITLSSSATIVSDGLINLPDPAAGASAWATISIENPPRWLTVRFGAGTFPSSNVGSYVFMQASWR